MIKLNYNSLKMYDWAEWNANKKKPINDLLLY